MGSVVFPRKVLVLLGVFSVRGRRAARRALSHFTYSHCATSAQRFGYLRSGCRLLSNVLTSFARARHAGADTPYPPEESTSKGRPCASRPHHLRGCSAERPRGSPPA